MQKIIPHLWFDKEAKEVAKFYTSVFASDAKLSKKLAESKVTNTTTLHNTPSGDCDIVSFDIWGYSFMAISAGPLFKINPSISFMINFDPAQDKGQNKDAQKRIDVIWNELIKGGKALMPIDKYPFSERYGWVEDKYGVSWQLILTNPNGEERPLIIPSLMFKGNKYGKAEEATDFYIKIFNNAKRGAISRYPAGMDPHKEGTVMFTDFQIENVWFAAMDAPGGHDFDFNEAISFIVNCEDQKEIDYYWEKLSAVPESEQCGWLKDKYGVSWQITPIAMNEMMKKGTQEQIDRITQAFLPMKKIEIAKLERVYGEK
jgi:predicted 3-demethylubiquinone-9 3-methyltransferase (glyoxalase superfamily)